MASSIQELDSFREHFRQEVAGKHKPLKFTSRIGVVLSGGGARSSYEAGVLMAFHDAEIPTHHQTQLGESC